MPLVDHFVDSAEAALGQELLDDGFVIRDVVDLEALHELRHHVAVTVAKYLDCAVPENVGDFLDNIHNLVTVEKLNHLRLGVYQTLNQHPWFRPTFFRLGRPYLETLVGNELAMQNRVNLSIQMPRDHSSLLDIHSDIFGGESPYEVVQWLPLVDVQGTKSMYILPRRQSIEVSQDLNKCEKSGMAGLFDVLKDQLVWLNVPYGKVLIFSPACLHGNTINEEATSRWSFNCRFVSLLGPTFSPEKSLGAYYLPITVKPATRIGINYRQPDGFHE